MLDPTVGLEAHAVPMTRDEQRESQGELKLNKSWCCVYPTRTRITEPCGVPHDSGPTSSCVHSALLAVVPQEHTVHQAGNKEGRCCIPEKAGRYINEKAGILLTFHTVDEQL